MSVSPERAAKTFSRPPTRSRSEAPPSYSKRAAPRRDDRETKKEAKARRIVLAWQGSGGAIQELLRLCLHLQPSILMRLVARNGGDALHEIEDAFRGAAFLGQHGVAPLGLLGFGEAATTQKFGAILVAACHDPLAGGLDAVDEGQW